MFGPPGHAYVYRSYGIHWLLNLVCGPVGYGAAVLVRALALEHGVERARARRPGVRERDLCRGPGRLALALAVRPEHDGLPLDSPPFALHPPAAPARVEVSTRIGITRGVERPWRFAEAGSRYASPLRGGAATSSG
jgi:DNA-3-methyladenine glycosylase